MTASPSAPASKNSPHKLVVKLYQFFHVSSTFLYAALLIRWLILFPLVSSKFLPGGMHRFLCGTMLYTAIGNILWWIKFRGLNLDLFNRFVLKNVNLIYFVSVMHFHDDFEHSAVLKNMSYSTFIIGLAVTQSYHHFSRIFKAPSKQASQSKSWYNRFNTFVMIPCFYLSEFYLLLLNTEIDNYHNGPKVVLLNKIVLVVFFPVCFHFYKLLVTS